MVIVIDNYDSFTYNLVQRLGEIDRDINIQVFRNDEVSTDQIASYNPSRLLVSPGPVHARPKPGSASTRLDTLPARFRFLACA